jgi:transposase-like protein
MGSITAEVIETGEKRDKRGYRVTPMARRTELVREYQKSGLTQAEFARREGIKYATFAGWVLKAAKQPPAPSLIQFAQLRLPAPVPPPTAAKTTGLEVHLPDGTSVRGNKVKELAALIRALRA